MTGEELRRIRVARGFTQRKLGELLGYKDKSAETVVQNWEYGKQPIPLARIRKLAQILNMPIERFIP